MSAFRAVLVALSAAALTAACAAGQHAATSIEKPSVDGTQGRVGSMLLEDVSMHAPTAASYPSGADVALTLYLANNGHTSDTLTNVTSSAFTGWTVVPTASVAAQTGSAAGGTPQVIGAGGALGLGLSNLTPAGGTSPKTLVLTGLVAKSAPLFPGTPVAVTFSFAKAGSTTLTVPVQITEQPNTQTLPGTTAPDN